MANPAGERAVRLKRPLRGGLRFVGATSALTGVLLAGCGSGDDRPKVEDSLRDYLRAVIPEESSFPLGAGVPRVKHNACKDGHVKVQKGKLLSDMAGQWRAPTARF
jgi:hypothetical protein